MRNTIINKVIEEFSYLPLEDKEYVAEIINRQLIDLKRESIAGRASEAKMNFEKGLVKSGTIKDLREDLESD